MISLFQRRELTVCQTQARSDEVCAKLDQAGIEYQVKARDRSSPSGAGMRPRLPALRRPSAGRPGARKNI